MTHDLLEVTSLSLFSLPRPQNYYHIGIHMHRVRHAPNVLAEIWAKHASSSSEHNAGKIGTLRRKTST